MGGLPRNQQYLGPSEIPDRLAAISVVDFPNVNFSHLVAESPMLKTGIEGGDKVRQRLASTRRATRTKGARRRPAA
jgi:hypothetical protein